MTFESWTVSSDQSHTTEVDTIPATNPTQWYWNDAGPKPTPETVKCKVTVTLPANLGNSFSFTVTAPMPVKVQVPGWTASGTGGYMQINANAPNENGQVCIYAGPKPGQGGGMNWKATVSSPNLALFGPGTLELVQLITPNESYTSYTGSMIPGAQHTDKRPIGLDTLYPAPWISSPSPYTTNESPTLPLDGTVGTVALDHSFTDYVMCAPPGSSQYVPLGTFTWSLNGSATVPSSETQFTAGNTFPKWTQINRPIKF